MFRCVPHSSHLPRVEVHLLRPAHVPHFRVLCQVRRVQLRDGGGGAAHAEVVVLMGREEEHALHADQLEQHVVRHVEVRPQLQIGRPHLKG
eukprot:8460232-Pyramimonas_sp.AAC.1